MIKTFEQFINENYNEKPVLALDEEYGTVLARFLKSVQDRADRSDLCGACKEEPDVQANLMETEASEKCLE